MAVRDTLQMNEMIQKIQKKIEQGISILVIGDVITDIWVTGHETDNCQEGCKKFIQESVIVVPGGARNASSSLCKWNTRVSLIGQDINNRCIKTRFINSATNKVVFRHDDEKHFSSREYPNRLRVNLNRILNEVYERDGVLISDYTKGFIDKELVKEVVSICDKRNIPCVADCKSYASLYRGCIIKGNSNYFANVSSIETALNHSLKKGVVVTQGEKSPLVCTYDSEGEMHVRTVKSFPPVQCVNYVGAGDCFSAHLVLGLSCGLSLLEATTLAHSAGRVYVKHPYNRPPYPYEIDEDLKSSEIAYDESRNEIGLGVV